uniref:Uncharacterized protein n=1 Tax=Anguilla anguilla TaxID=7936 RepID=A0A0E9VTC9_ANGAN
MTSGTDYQNTDLRSALYRVLAKEEVM